MNAEQLRDHAEQILKAIAHDLGTTQTQQESIDKSKGLAPRHPDESAAQVHAVARLGSGFTIDQMVSEYRALRASVLLLWSKAISTGTEFEVEDMRRFNEAIDQALAESVGSYSRAAEEARGIFLGILGHDLRTPLGAVSMGAQALLHAEDLDSRSTRVAARIFSSAERAGRIVENLLDFTRTQLGARIPIRRSSTDLIRVCKGIVEETRAYYLERSIRFKAQGQALGQFDADRLEQVFSNLLTNAIQHGAEGSPVTITINGNPDNVEITVHNEGTPIPESAIAHIFNPMTRCASQGVHEDGPRSGLGLGLYIAKEIVVAHNGTIEVSSSSADGTVFTVQFPLPN